MTDAIEEARKAARRANEDVGEGFISGAAFEAYEAKLAELGYARVRSEALAEKIARLMAQTGNCLDPDTIVPIYGEKDGYSAPIIGEQPRWRTELENARDMIQAATSTAGR